MRASTVVLQRVGEMRMHLVDRGLGGDFTIVRIEPAPEADPVLCSRDFRGERTS